MYPNYYIYIYQYHNEAKPSLELATPKDVVEYVAEAMEAPTAAKASAAWRPAKPV